MPLPVPFANRPKPLFRHYSYRRRNLPSSHRSRRASPESTTELALTAHGLDGGVVPGLSSKKHTFDEGVADTTIIQSKSSRKQEIVEGLIERLLSLLSSGAWLRQPTPSLCLCHRLKPKPAPAGPPHAIKQHYRLDRPVASPDNYIYTKL